MPEAELWSIDRLCELVAAELLASDQSQPSARVREVPDRRTIRWYTTIGLLDRPAEMRGRTAMYGRRHLLQIVAIKRLQATGTPLAEVQEQLAAATSSTLEKIAELSAGPGRERMARPARGPAQQAVPQAGGAEPTAGPVGRRSRFWAAAELSAAAATPATPATLSAPAVAAATQPAIGSARRGTVGGPVRGAAHDDSALIPAIRLGGGVTLTLSQAGRLPDAEDIAAIRRAAGPLLDLLHARGLDAHNIWEDR